MLKRIVVLIAGVCLLIGGAQYVSNNPKEAGNNGANLLNEGAEAGGGLIEGFSEFIGALDF